MQNKIDKIKEIAGTHDNFYFYDGSRIGQAITTMKEAFGNARILYSVKTNPNKDILRLVQSRGLGADAASIGEVLLCREMGFKADSIYYSTLGKTEKDIRCAIDQSIIIADSLNEIRIIDKVAQAQGVIAEIGVRINPDYSFDALSKGGLPSKFGIDEEQFFAHWDHLSQLPYVKIVGLHVHLRSQETDECKLFSYIQNTLDLASKVQDSLNTKLKFLNLGSGIGIKYPGCANDMNMDSLSAKSADAIRLFSDRFPDTSILIESGRYIVGESGWYITKVLDKKVSKGKTFVILKSTLNGFIRPSIAKLIEECSGGQSIAGHEPLYTCNEPSKIIVLNDNVKEEKVTLVGNLCTATDVVATDVNLPLLQPGDIVAFTHAGSYAAVLTPFQFSLHEKPLEFFCE